ncbi:MAG TPA: ATP synthase A1 subunit C [Methanomassiliicoccales archaeon]|nr:ATP synthase A1 subunit C [Methanomassiliicoccales archaeon]
MAYLLGSKGNYPYACARVRAKKSQLLTKESYPKLLNMDLNEISRFLGETQYNAEMTELATKYEGVNLIELGMSRNLARVYGAVLGFTKGELRQMVSSYLERWDIWNVKTVVRGKHSKATLDEIREDLVPAGKLKEEDLSALLAMETVAEVLEGAEKMVSIFLPEEIVSSYQTTGQLSAIEDYLDKVYYRRLIESISPRSHAERLLLAYVRREIDATNLMTLLKLKREGLGPDKIAPFMIEGGDELPMAQLERLLPVEGYDALLQELTRLSFYEEIKDALEKAKTSSSLDDVTLALKKYQIRQAEKFSHLYPLSVLPIIDYIIRKKTEVDNIRIVARCKESGLDPDTIKRLLVV